MENLFLAWQEFRKGKRSKSDVQEFEFFLEDNIFQLHNELKRGKYEHQNYTSFFICDPKLRHIYKARVRDRVLHHALFRILYPIFDKNFIWHSYSCRIGKGTHKAVDKLELFARKASWNIKRSGYALKCDIKRFFDSVDQEILLEIIKRKIDDQSVIRLIEIIVRSYEKEKGKGLPLGNVTSQLFANIYLNELDHFVKHNLMAKYYLRYCDDFMVLNNNKEYLEGMVKIFNDFLIKKLKLNLHFNKITLRKYHQGIDFLGYILRPHHRLIRTKTKKRIFKKIRLRIKEYKMKLITEERLEQSLQSYLGVLSHANAFGLSVKLKNQFWFWFNE